MVSSILIYRREPSSSHLMVVNCRSLQIKFVLFIVFVYLFQIVVTTSEFSGDNSTEMIKNVVELINNNTSRVESLRNVNFLVGIANQVVTNDVSRNESNDQVHVMKCVQEMEMFLDAVENDEIWAIKLIDSFGNMPKSFIWGNNFWFSSPELCADIHDPFYISLSSDIDRNTNQDLLNSSSPYRMHLQMIYFNYKSSLQLDLKQQYKPYIEVGVCVPESCSQDDITKWTTHYFLNDKFNPLMTYDIQMETVDSKLPGFNASILVSTGVILYIAIHVIMLILGILAEIIYRLQKRRLKINKNNAKVEAIFGENFLMCFSLRENFPRVIQASASKDFVPVIAGMRTIICAWVTILHIYYHSMFTRDNRQFSYVKLESLMLQPILQACFYVDVFFTISGFLLVYNLLSNAKHVETIKSNSILKNIKLYLKFALHRHFRLMPIFILTIVVSDLLFDLINMLSPFYVNGENDLYCKETWWYNLLYINNFLPLSKMCASWGWYIACEMQFYLFFLALLFIYVKSNTTGKTLFVLATGSFISVSYYCYYSSGISFQIDVISTTVDDVYMKPWTRITPYFSGVLMGWLLYKAKDTTVKFSKTTMIVFWLFASLIFTITSFMTYFKGTPIWLVSGIMSFGKLLFGIFIGSLICICQLGYGGIFAKIMGSKLFLYLNKFSFSMYMIAPIVISFLFGLRQEPVKYDEISSISDVVAILIISHIVSFAPTLFIELPFQRISSRFILGRV